MCCRGSNKNENSHLRANGDMSGHHTGVVLGHFVLMDTVSVNNIEMGIANRGNANWGQRYDGRDWDPSSPPLHLSAVR